jgi:hypothetical protein
MTGNPLSASPRLQWRKTEKSQSNVKSEGPLETNTSVWML